MLETLTIKNIGSIKNASLEFKPGLTVITGETGAGKSMLLSAFSLLAGQSPERIKTLKENLNEDIVVQSVWEDLGIVSRTINASSKRSRGFINDEIVTNAKLAETLEKYVKIHGQSDQLRLKNSQTVLELIDKVARKSSKLTKNGKSKQSECAVQTEFDDIYNEYLQNYTEFQKLTETLKEKQLLLENAEKNEEYYKFAIAQIENAQIDEEFDAQIDKKIAEISENAQKLEQFQAILHIINGEQSDFGVSKGINNELSDLINSLSQLNSDEYNDFIDKASDFAHELNEIESSIFAKCENSDSEISLERLLERQTTLNTLKKSWGPELEDVIKFYNLAKESQNSNLKIEYDKLNEQCVQIEIKTQTSAAKLTEIRQAFANEFAKKVNIQLSALGFTGAKVSFEHTTLTGESANFAPNYTATGVDRFELYFSPHSSVAAGPIGKIASGGELSRIMLAIECAFVQSYFDESAKHSLPHAETENYSQPVMVFDEIDAGIGGEAAVVVAKLLKDVSKTTQVIVVTHLASVAAKADTHFVITKSNTKITNIIAENNKTLELDELKTQINEVFGEDREMEIARMLSGNQFESSLLHAREMLMQ